MAKDIFGVLNGLGKVAVAFSSELGTSVRALSRKTVTLSPFNANGPVWQITDNPDATIANCTLLPSGLCDNFEDSELATEFRQLTRSQETEHIRSSPPNNELQPSPSTRLYHTSTRPSYLPPGRSQTRHLHTRPPALTDATITGSTKTGGGKKTSKERQKMHHRARERAVPSSRLGRMASFGGLAAGLGFGTAAEVAKRAVGFSHDDANILLSEGNVERIVSTLCKVRGAALKIGQTISLQDGSLVPEAVQQVFERVRNNADFMPTWQLEGVLERELGVDWRDKLAEFDPQPLAAASIGQVHRAVLVDGREVAIKIQYPGVGESINSDIDNLVGVLKVWNILPEGLFIDHMISVAGRELAWEVDYVREAKCSSRFKELLSSDERFAVPAVIPELSADKVLTTELINGQPLDQCEGLPQSIKNGICERIMELCLREVLEFRFMQTDPNWSNFYFNEAENKIYLLDFGASREYSKTFTDDYIKVIHAAVMGDKKRVIELSKKLGFITGYESQAHLAAHVDSVMILGEPFSQDRPFDFNTQDTTRRIQRLLPSLLEDRLAPPPEESYSIHRKMAGSFLLCAKLKAKINCYNTFQKAWNSYKF